MTKKTKKPPLGLQGQAYSNGWQVLPDNYGSPKTWNRLDCHFVTPSVQKSRVLNPRVPICFEF